MEFLDLLIVPLRLDFLPDLALTGMILLVSKYQKLRLVYKVLKYEYPVSINDSWVEDENRFNECLELTVSIWLLELLGICGRRLIVQERQIARAVCEDYILSMGVRALWTSFIMVTRLNGSYIYRTWHCPSIFIGAVPYGNLRYGTWKRHGATDHSGIRLAWAMQLSSSGPAYLVQKHNFGR